MREAFRYPQYAFVFGGEFHCDVLPESRQTFSYVHSDIEHRALHHAYQFALGMLGLVVQAAQHVFDRAMVVLNEINIAACQFGEFAPVEAFEEEAAVVAEYFGLDNQQAGDGGFNCFNLENFFPRASVSDSRHRWACPG